MHTVEVELRGPLPRPSSSRRPWGPQNDSGVVQHQGGLLWHWQVQLKARGGGRECTRVYPNHPTLRVQQVKLGYTQVSVEDLKIQAVLLRRLEVNGHRPPPPADLTLGQRQQVSHDGR